jgi:3-oxoacyl-[acyl-carrier protein] reductase
MSDPSEFPVPPAPRVALVTGATRGLGLATARTLAAAGHRVALNFRNDEAAAQAAMAALGAAGGVMLARGDATTAAGVEALAATVEAAWGGIDVLVVNATPPQPMRRLEDYTWDEYQTMLDAFVKSPFLLAQRLVPRMKARRWGRIVNITSEVFHLGVPQFSAYVAAKGGQIGWSRSVAVELAPHGITVNTVAPGWIPVERHAGDPAAAKAAYLATIPAGRWGTPEDVADAVLHFARPEAGFLTGQTLLVNGGRSPW